LLVFFGGGESFAHFKTEDFFGVQTRISKNLKEVERYMWTLEQ